MNDPSRTTGRPPGRRLDVPEEVAFFGRSAAYAIFIAVVYWLVAHEVAGTVLLGGFGVASLVLTLYLLWRRPRRGGQADSGDPDPLAPDGPFGDESGAVPSPTFAPLELAAGLALLVLAVPFGVAMVLAAVIPLAAGGVGWLRAVQSEPAFREHGAEDEAA